MRLRKIRQALDQNNSQNGQTWLSENAVLPHVHIGSSYKSRPLTLNDFCLTQVHTKSYRDLFLRETEERFLKRWKVQLSKETMYTKTRAESFVSNG